MKRIVMTMLLIGGSVCAQNNKQATTPAEVSTSLVAEIRSLASNHAELAEFPDYAKTMKSASNLLFTRRIRPVITKRLIRPSDFEKHGISLWFELFEDDGDRRPDRQAKSTYFPHLKLRLYTHLTLWEGASPELEKTLKTIMEKHKAMLSELDKKADKKKDSDDK